MKKQCQILLNNKKYLKIINITLTKTFISKKSLQKIGIYQEKERKKTWVQIFFFSKVVPNLPVKYLPIEVTNKKPNSVFFYSSFYFFYQLHHQTRENCLFFFFFVFVGFLVWLLKDSQTHVIHCIVLLILFLISDLFPVKNKPVK